MAEAAPKAKAPVNKVMTYGTKKNSIAIASATNGRGLVKVNGVPLNLVQPIGLRLKLQEPLLVVPREHFRAMDIRVRVRGGGQVSRVYAIRQAIAKASVAYAQKFVDEATKQELKAQLSQYDKSLLVADPRRREPKKFGGHGARARRAKSYR
eukprot:NODE_6468_length_626_cov_163.317158_g5515_i0.p2 GENE.NODE_6468_length_626_cov_163.317158_g5515_i0~~NODE_6468_length_626_cov_163.317158_g5515_i0.p2  ORF type:complete len:152 (+),score=54.02 NODE_6468_length_626_cov_163.317158_g5515_i0:94-549(+)